MKSNKRMQALLSTAMCAAILFSNAAALRIDYKYIHNVILPFSMPFPIPLPQSSEP